MRIVYHTLDFSRFVYTFSNSSNEIKCTHNMFFNFQKNLNVVYILFYCAKLTKFLTNLKKLQILWNLYFLKIDCFVSSY